MRDWGIGGEWIGEYIYDPSIKWYSRAPAAVAFSLSLTARSFGRFCGQVKDDPEQGMSGTGDIRGWRIGSRVSFKKYMNELQVRRHDDGIIVPLNELVRVRFGVEIGSVPHPPIKYRGRLSADRCSMEGTWRIDPHNTEIPGHKPIQFGAGWGTWHAKRS
jgi:hypothetical protein